MPPRRPYRLSPEGLASLQAAARRNRPWEFATGPKTASGKAQSSRNAWKHGERSNRATNSRVHVTMCLGRLNHKSG